MSEERPISAQGGFKNKESSSLLESWCYLWLTKNTAPRASTFAEECQGQFPLLPIFLTSKQHLIKSACSFALKEKDKGISLKQETFCLLYVSASSGALNFFLSTLWWLGSRWPPRVEGPAPAALRPSVTGYFSQLWVDNITDTGN